VIQVVSLLSICVGILGRSEYPYTPPCWDTRPGTPSFGTSLDKVLTHVFIWFYSCHTQLASLSSCHNLSLMCLHSYNFLLSSKFWDNTVVNIDDQQDTNDIDSGSMMLRPPQIADRALLIAQSRIQVHWYSTIVCITMVDRDMVNVPFNFFI